MSADFRKPRRLAPGDTIGIIAPAAPISSAVQLRAGVAVLESWGLRVRLGRHVADRAGHLAGTDQDRAADLLELWTDPDVHAVLCFAAGYGSSRLIRLLDPSAFGGPQKLLCGFSDITALHLAVHAWSSTVTLYSINGSDLASREPDCYSVRSLHEALFSGQAPGEIGRPPEGPVARGITGGRATGRLVGGCLPLVIASIGTRIQLDVSGAILVLEDAPDRPWAELERSLVHLRDAGVLEGVVGVAFGEVGEEGRRYRDVSIDTILADVLGPLGVPVVVDLPIGHGRHHATLPLGAEATIDADRAVLVIEEVITAPP